MSLAARTALALCLTLCGACTTVRQLRDPLTLPVDGRAARTRSPDALDYSIAIFVAAKPEVVWALLTDARAFARWNSTLVKLEGTIGPGGEIELVSKIAPDRTFHLKVTTFEPPHRMVWEDGNGMFLGVRHFTLSPAEGGTTVAMSETYSGFFLHSAEEKMPDFTQNFEQFAADLKRACETPPARP